MRFPKLIDLDAEQRAIYNGAPPAESILVIGPPGTGKTVMAFHRAAFLQALSKKKADKALDPRVIMYNAVLATYTAARENLAPDADTSTMHSWAWGWWKEMFGSQIPTMPEDRYVHDWQEIFRKVVEHKDEKSKNVHWGHLIVDEGQDFPKEMYAVLGMISRILPTGEGMSSPPLTVFADENQRLQHGTNSSIKDIEDALSLPSGRKYKLSKNYRNTKQIASFSRHFYVGLESGIPALPERIGKTKPRVVLASSLEVVRRRVSIFASNNPGMDIGVLCARDYLRTKVYNSLQSRLAGTKLIVQTYSRKTKGLHPADKLQFDRGGSITLLNFHSAKGLEFDAVFLVDPFVDSGGAGAQLASMQLYVMTSRARDYLELLVMDKPADLDVRLPPSELYEKVEE
ncbi:AAA family ATPase [Stenotrophomonas maltophilia]|uniref:AAA family ATPase n=1 Tax=Stenotrophomonas maltophilia TaxID=40324 RepID=UPI001F5380D4|nr:AAA family ATPase [Stenotrophomonas maltophilia]MCI1130331.1 AAA family ATPase [Stenotrophomonas maltophilia]